MNIVSILRHWFTLAATVATAWLVATLALDAEQQAQIAKAFGDISEPLIVLSTLLVTALWRIALAWLSKIFRNGSGELDNRGPSGGAGLLLLITAVALGGALPSCQPGQIEAFRAIPIKGCFITDQGTVCYSSKGGLSYEIDRRSNK